MFLKMRKRIIVTNGTHNMIVYVCNQMLYCFVVVDCQAIGQFLPHPTNKCRYLRCSYGNDPWKDSEGRVVLFTLEQDCPPGTSVNRTVFFYSFFGYHANRRHFNGYFPVTPCTIIDHDCPIGMWYLLSLLLIMIAEYHMLLEPQRERLILIIPIISVIS